MVTPTPTLYQAILIVSVVIGVIITYFFITIVRYHRRNLQLYRERLAAEVQTLESERARIAADLHDDLGPLLTAIKFRLQTLDLPDQENEAHLEKTLGYIDDLVLRMRHIATELVPAALKKNGLIAAISLFIEQQQQPGMPRIHFQYPEQLPPIHPGRNIHLYRIIQELIHNGCKHAQASAMWISLAIDGEQLFINYQDDGKGVQGKSLLRQPVTASHGVANLQNRTEILQGEWMQVSRKKENGLALQFSFPIAQICKTDI